MNEPQTERQFFGEKFCVACRTALIRCGVPAWRAHVIIRELAFWISVVTSIARELCAFARSIPGGFRLAQSEQLSRYSTPCDRFRFIIAYVFGLGIVVREMVAEVVRNARGYRASWKKGGASA